MIQIMMAKEKCVVCGAPEEGTAACPLGCENGGDHCCGIADAWKGRTHHNWLLMPQYYAQTANRWKVHVGISK